MSFENMVEGDSFGWSLGESQELKVEKSAKERLLANLSSAVTVLTLLAVLAYVVLIIPVAVILWRVAL